MFEQLTTLLRNKYEQELELSESEIEFIGYLVERVIDYVGEDPNLKNEDGEAAALLTMAAEELLKVDSLRNKFDLASMKLKLLEEIRDQQLRKEAAELLEQDLQLPSGTVLKRESIPDIQTPIGSSEKLTTFWEKYDAEKLKTGQWKHSKTAQENREAFRSFLDVVGDIAANTLDKRKCTSYVEEMQDYPRNRFRNDNGQLTLAQARENIADRLSLASYSNRITMISSFMNWLVAREAIAKNPLTGIIPQRNTRTEKREPFEHDDLVLIFSQERFRGQHKHDWQYWLPLLALYTGGRIEELCQLRGRDVSVNADGIHLIRIRDHDEFSGKSENAERVIPIHQKLIDLGFLRLAEAAEKDYIFMLKSRDGKKSVEPSKEFGRLEKKLGFSQRKTFHAFRNTFISALARADVTDSKIAELAGHAQGNVTFNRYWRADEESLNRAIQRLDFNSSLKDVECWEISRP